MTNPHGRAGVFIWYYAIGFYRNAIPTGAVTERSGLMFLLI